MRMQLNRIICATDFSGCSRFTIPTGVALAKEFGARLYICHVVDFPLMSAYGEAIRDPALDKDRITRDAGEEISALMGEQAVEWESLVVLGRTADEIERLSSEKDADLVISATHGRSGLKRLVLGSVTEHLMRRLACPLLVVRSAEESSGRAGDRPITLQKILVGCDFSPDSDLGFQYALSFAQQFQAELHLAHVVEPSAYKELRRSEGREGIPGEKDLRDRLKEQLNRMVPEDALHWCTPKTVLLAGQPHEELSKYALVNGVDLMVLGFRGCGLMETLFVGSTTARAIRNAPCAVLSVQPTVY
jgi:nucleotide-binding universal stress UspA family protein